MVIGHSSGYSNDFLSTVHQPQLRGECHGELIQIDDRDHGRFEDQDAMCPEMAEQKN
jgi:hypothetical protein